MFKDDFNIFCVDFLFLSSTCFPLLAYVECHFLLDYDKLDFIITVFFKQNLALLFLSPSSLPLVPPQPFS